MDFFRIYEDFLLEAQNFKGTFEEFAQVRHDGAQKITDAAKEKGGAALLTYHHFKVKLPYYKKAANGKFNIEDAKKDLDANILKLKEKAGNNVNFTQTDFQKTVGIIEVLGELIIFKQSKAI
jgi:hypothetical protein